MAARDAHLGKELGGGREGATRNTDRKDLFAPEADVPQARAADGEARVRGAFLRGRHEDKGHRREEAEPLRRKGEEAFCRFLSGYAVLPNEKESAGVTGSEGGKPEVREGTGCAHDQASKGAIKNRADKKQRRSSWN